jgi:dihydropyrimidinase
MVQLMKTVKENGGLVTVHATNGDMIDSLIAKNLNAGNTKPIYHYLSQPEVTEAEASARFTDMLHYTGCPGYIVHMTCEGAINAVRKSTMRNQKVFVETCPQYLTLDASLYKRADGAKWVMSPPLREKKDQSALWSGINQGLIQVIGTDHCPFTWKQKQMGKNDFSKIPNGHPAIEHRMELLFSEGVRKGRISLSKYVALTSTNAAKIFGMYPKKGTIAIGADADLVIFNPTQKHTLSKDSHHMNADYSSYEGFKVIGKTETVLLRGQVAIEK